MSKAGLTLNHKIGNVSHKRIYLCSRLQSRCPESVSKYRKVGFEKQGRQWPSGLQDELIIIPYRIYPPRPTADSNSNQKEPTFKMSGME